MSIEDAADQTIDECIREGILEEFLRKHKVEAKSMSIFEYDQEKHLRMEREEARVEAVKDVAKRMLLQEFPDEQIIKLCGISSDDLEKCRKSLELQ